ncbi:AAA family ATPase [Pelomonas sp. CA6]|uniref:AAA family ATPase n=1 Tax=Pelomonas sp. CA6 TaxID=2907999 RepID=UPI001F4C0C6F|nr:AAA family ATPase [Pelomonas sp. CA6]MCH7343322.1 AAA family ATPase [Pelomonas sp. CA6]
MNPDSLRLHLLGAPRLMRGEMDLGREIRYRKAWALLGLLCFPPATWQARSQLATLLWPDLASTAALTNLRQILSNLQQVLGKHLGRTCLQVERERVRLDPDPLLWVDTLALERLSRDSADSPALLQADELAQVVEPQLQSLSADLLEGLEQASGDAYLRWLQTSRLQVRSWQQSLRLQVCEAQQRSNRLAAAVLSARLLWEQDPLSEPAAERLMRLLLRVGDRRGAQQVLVELDRKLLGELGLRVSPRLRTLVEPRSTVPLESEPCGPEAPLMRETRAMAWCFVTVAAPAASSSELDATTLQAARTLLRPWHADVRPVTGRGFHAGFGDAGHPEQAARRCALAVRELLKALPGRLRVGLVWGQMGCHSGPEGVDWFGDLPDEARALSQQAGPGMALGNKALADRVAMFATTAQGALVLQPESREEDPPAQRRYALVGREKELAILIRHWRFATEGRPAWVVVQGEAGVGKTRLAQAFAAQVEAQGGLVLRMHGALERQSSPLAPLRAALLSALSPDAQALGRSAAQARLAALLTGLPDREELLATLLHFLFDEDTAASAPLEGRDQRFWACFALLDALAQRQPVLLWGDDLHWSDLATREWLSHYAGLLAEQRLLLLSTTRPDAGAGAAATPPHLLELGALAQGAAGQLVTLCDPHGQLDEAAHRQIAADSAGVPLFIEHLVRRRLAGESSPAHQVDELLTLELDRMGAFKPVLQSAAVLGNEFHASHLTLLWPHQELQPVLELACHCRLIVPLGRQSYAFRHALIRDAAYRSLPSGQARQVHARFAGWLAVQPEAMPGEVAAHLEASQQWRPAIAWWQRAGMAAMGRQFASDALRSLQRALALAEWHAADEPALIRALQFAVAHASLLSQGYGSALGYALFESIAKEIKANGRPEDDEDLFRALSGLYMGGSSQKSTEGLAIGRRLERLADSPTKRLMVCFALGNSLFWHGEFKEALAYQQEGAALAEALPAEERTRYWSDDLGVLIRAFQVWTCWFLGDMAQAQVAARQGLALARQGGQPHALCFVLAFVAAMHWSDDDARAARRHAEEGLGLARRFGFPLWQGIHGLFVLWCDAREDRLSDVGAVQQAAQTFRQAYQAGSTTANWVVTSILLQLDLHEELADTVAHTRRHLEQSQDLYCQAEVLLLQAIGLARQGQAQQAAALSAEARALAHDQHAAGLLRRLDRLAQIHGLTQGG